MRRLNIRLVEEDKILSLFHAQFPETGERETARSRACRIPMSACRRVGRETPRPFATVVPDQLLAPGGLQRLQPLVRPGLVESQLVFLFYHVHTPLPAGFLLHPLEAHRPVQMRGGRERADGPEDD